MGHPNADISTTVHFVNWFWRADVWKRVARRVRLKADKGVMGPKQVICCRRPLWTIPRLVPDDANELKDTKLAPGTKKNLCTSINRGHSSGAIDPCKLLPHSQVAYLDFQN